MRRPSVQRTWASASDRSVAGGAAIFREACWRGVCWCRCSCSSWAATAAAYAAGRRRRRLGCASRRGVALHRKADRGGRHAGGFGLYADPDGQEFDLQPGPRSGRDSPWRSAAGIDGADRALHGFEDRVRDDLRCVPVYERIVRLYFGQGCGGRSGSAGHAAGGVLFATVSGNWWA